MKKEFLQLSACNSSGSQKLDVVYDPEYPDEVHFCLWGKYEGDDIQIDFDNLSREEWDEFRRYVNRVDKRIKSNKPTINI